MANQQKRGLGKGLGALLGNDADLSGFRRPVQYVNETPSDRGRTGGIVMVAVTDIEPNPLQPRVSFNADALEELAASIRSLGLIQPLTVRSINGGKYQIISGERRFRACRMAGLEQVPAYVRKAEDDISMLEMAIVENVQRADLDPIETAMSYQRLIDECDLTQEAMSDRIGKSRESVTNYLRLLKLPARVQYDLKMGNISVGHAKVLLGVSDAGYQEELAAEIQRSGLSVRALENLIRSGKARRSSSAAPAVRDSRPGEYAELLDLLGTFSAGKVSAKRSASGKGSVTLHFADDAEMNAFLEALRKSKL